MGSPWVMINTLAVIMFSPSRITDQNSDEVVLQNFPILVRVLEVLCLILENNSILLAIIILHIIKIFNWPQSSFICIKHLLGQWISSWDAHQTYSWSFIKIQISRPSRLTESFFFLYSRFLLVIYWIFLLNILRKKYAFRLLYVNLKIFLSLFYVPLKQPNFFNQGIFHVTKPHQTFHIWKWSIIK